MPPPSTLPSGAVPSWIDHNFVPQYLDQAVGAVRTSEPCLTPIMATGQQREKYERLGCPIPRWPIAAMTVEGSTDTEVFLTYVQTILVPTLPGQIVMIGNLPLHTDERIQTAIESVGATLEYLPSYSPDFSPIEPCWSKVKALLRATRPEPVKHSTQPSHMHEIW